MENPKIVTVAPITKSILNEDLTYFTTKDITTGALVVISLRSKEVLGIVTSVSEATEMKSELKTSEFGFKKIKKIISGDVYLKDFIEASREIAEYFASPLGQVIKAMTPKVIIEEWQKRSSEQNVSSAGIINDIKNKRFEISIIGMLNEERYSFYKSLIREEFAKKHSVIFILPTIHDAEECGEILQKGIEKYTIILHGRLTPKTISLGWHTALTEDHPVLIVATPTFLSLPRHDIATIIIDKENSQFYKSLSRPFIDIRTFAEKLAIKRNAKLVLGDCIPRVVDIYNAESGAFIQESPLKYRFPMNLQQRIIDMRKAKDEDVLISPQIRQVLKDSIENKEHALVICTRKGLGTSTVCSDCGEIIICSKCSLPMIVHRSGSENIFYCNRCGQKWPTDVKCAKCASWKLKILGIATERVENEIKSLFPKAKIFRIDGNAIKSYKQAREIITQFLQTPGSLLIGTEMALSYLNQDVENVAIISIDTLFSIPDYKTNEVIFNFLSRLRLHAIKRFIIQTRRPDEKIFASILSGDLLEFYREEIKLRKKFNYPPFKLLIKITAEGPKNVTNKEMDQLEKFLHKYQPSKFDAFIERINDQERINILLRIEPDKWPNLTAETSSSDSEAPYSNLLEILRSLPKRFMVKIDPENIL